MSYALLNCCLALFLASTIHRESLLLVLVLVPILVYMY